MNASELIQKPLFTAWFKARYSYTPFNLSGAPVLPAIVTPAWEAWMAAALASAEAQETLAKAEQVAFWEEYRKAVRAPQPEFTKESP